MATESPAIASTSSSSSSSTTFSDLPPDVLTRTLRLLDGPTLASASSATSLLRSLSSHPDLWLHLSLSTWPSLHHPRTLPFLLSPSPRSFFSDAFPFPVPSPSLQPKPPHQLISAVDIRHRGLPIFSRVIETQTSSPWFRGSPFLIDATDPKPDHPIPPTLPEPIVSPHDLSLSWILIDPARARPVNVSSRRPVAVERNCYTGETVLRFAAPGPDGERVVAAVVTCGEGMGRVRDVVLTAEDVDGTCVSGEEAMRLLGGMMDGGRKGRGRWEEEEEEEEEFKERYSDFLRRKRRRKESRATREGVLDLCCTAIGVAVFLGFLSLIVFR